MSSINKIRYAIEYYDMLFEEIGDDQWGWIRGKLNTEYFEDECDFNKRVTDIEAYYDDYEITGLYVGEFRKITR